MKLILIAGGVILLFILVWRFYVVPAEKRHHERKLEALRAQFQKAEQKQSEGASDRGN